MTFTTADQITSAIKQCITSEMVPDGILSDVSDFIPSYRLEDSMDLPAVWLFEHPTTLDNTKAMNPFLFSLTTSYEFVCVDYDDDIEQAEIKCKNLAWRVGKTILKNRDLKIDDRKVFSKIEFQTLYPVGEIQIQGKLNKIPATSIVFDVYYNIEWLEKPETPLYRQVEMGDVTTEITADGVTKK